MARWTRHLSDWPTWIKENCVQHLFRTYGSLGNTWAFFLSFRFHCLLSALLCGSNMCTQVSSPVSKLEITRLLQPLNGFKSSRAHLRRCVFCSSVSKWGTHLAQTFLRSKRFFRIVCTLPSDMPVQLAISLTIAHPVRPQSFFFFFFLFGFYGPFKNISLISSRSFIEGGRKPENPEKNHLTIRKQNLAFPHMTRARLEPQRWET